MTWKAKPSALSHRVNLALVFVFVLAGRAAAQCEPAWQADVGLGGILPGAWASIAWDPDRAGPLKEVLVVGGALTAAGDRVVQGVAMWDGEHWSPLGAPTLPVRALAEYNGDLIAGLQSGSPGLPDNLIVRWTADAWAPVGGIGQTGSVRALHVHEGDLIAGGSFLLCDGVQTNQIARWDGTQWHAIGAGLAINGSVLCLTSYDGHLFAAGQFEPLFGSIQNIARWDGEAWQSVSGGFKDPVHAMTTFDGGLVVAGDFDYYKQTLMSRVAFWSGGVWQPLGKGIPGSKLRSLIVFNGRLIAGGTINFFDNPHLLAEWNGQTWDVGKHALKGSSADTLTEFDGKLIAAGGVRYHDGDDVVGLQNIGAWDEMTHTWSALPDGVPVPVSTETPKPATPFEGGVVVADSFFNFGGLTGARVMHWTGGDLSHASVLGKSFNSVIESLTVHQGTLMLSTGPEVDYDGKVIHGVASWDGHTWSQIGNGLRSELDCLHSTGSMLVAGGEITWPDSGLKHGAAYFNGVQWLALGTGMQNCRGRQLASHAGTLYALRSYSTPGGGAAITVVRLDGASWTQLGPVMSVSGTERLIAGAGGVYLSGGSAILARWDGQGWIGASDGSVKGIRDLQMVGDDLFALGMKNSKLGIHRLVGEEWEALDPTATIDGLRFTPSPSGFVMAGSAALADGRFAAPWVRLGCNCQADCDRSGSLNIDDFVCFQTLFAMGEPGADCNGSGELNIEDFVCFQTVFAVGC